MQESTIPCEATLQSILEGLRLFDHLETKRIAGWKPDLHELQIELSRIAPHLKFRRATTPDVRNVSRLGARRSTAKRSGS